MNRSGPEGREGDDLIAVLYRLAMMSFAILVMLVCTLALILTLFGWINGAGPWAGWAALFLLFEQIFG